MKEQIKKVQDYFKNKIITGDYEVVECSEQLVVGIVDEINIFHLWVSNGAHHFKTYDGKRNSMDLVFESSEQEKAYNIAKNHHNEFVKKELIARKREELEYLEASIK